MNFNSKRRRSNREAKCGTHVRTFALPKFCTVDAPNTACVWVEPQYFDKYRQRAIEFLSSPRKP